MPLSPVGAVLTSHMVWPAESRLYFSASLARGFCAVHKLENCTWRPYQWLLCCYIAGGERGWALCQSWGALLAPHNTWEEEMFLDYINRDVVESSRPLECKKTEPRKGHRQLGESDAKCGGP